MDVNKLSPGKKVPTDIFVVIEIPADSSVKYEVEKESGAVFVDRFLFTAMHYPFNYGFMPGTLADDGDPVDVLVVSGQPVHPGAVIRARPVGMLVMEDEAGKDEKILAVPVDKLDPSYADVKDVKDLPEILLKKVKHFFEHYKDLEPGKWVKLKEWKGRAEAEAYVAAAVK
jgi:inorganic pyrophosphatase